MAVQRHGYAGSHAAPHVLPHGSGRILNMVNQQFCVIGVFYLFYSAHGPRRGTEVVEAAVRHHIGACFGALERRILDAVAAAAQRLRDGGAAAGREHSLLQVGIRAKP